MQTSTTPALSAVPARTPGELEETYAALFLLPRGQAPKAASQARHSASPDGTKVCAQCGVSKSARDFYKKQASPDGLRADCKDCHKVRAKKNYEDRQELHRVMLYASPSLLRLHRATCRGPKGRCQICRDIDTP